MKAGRIFAIALLLPCAVLWTWSVRHNRKPAAPPAQVRFVTNGGVLTAQQLELQPTAIIVARVPGLWQVDSPKLATNEAPSLR